MKARSRNLLIVGTCLAFFASPFTAIAQADTKPEQVGSTGLCDSSKWDITITNMQQVYIPGGNRASGDPGLTISVSGEVSITATGTISPALTIQTDAIFARASAQAEISLALTQTIKQEISASATVPDGVQYGYAELGLSGRSFSATITRYNRNCVAIERYSGSAIGASPIPHFYLSWA
ncbi:MAG: hypothetical protein LBK54_03410 [Propionibacteriaceae bacterium]|jgi:hypothetical protein|nr:hypothetical protein [Propionibacteriaceae bacterium]